MRFAYADPPYVGCAHRYPEKSEVDHVALILRLTKEFPDGWALSCHTPSLRTILPICPDGARVLAWVKPFSIFKPGVGLSYSWEPVVLCGGRRRSRHQDTIRDWHASNITLKKGLVGAKPPGFCRWLLAALNFQAGDELSELYPGTAVMTRAAASYTEPITGPLFETTTPAGDEAS